MLTNETSYFRPIEFFIISCVTSFHYGRTAYKYMYIHTYIHTYVICYIQAVRVGYHTVGGYLAVRSTPESSTSST